MANVSNHPMNSVWRKIKEYLDSGDMESLRKVLDPMIESRIGDAAMKKKREYMREYKKRPGYKEKYIDPHRDELRKYNTEYQRKRRERMLQEKKATEETKPDPVKSQYDTGFVDNSVGYVV